MKSKKETYEDYPSLTSEEMLKRVVEMFGFTLNWTRTYLTEIGVVWGTFPLLPGPLWIICSTC